MQPIYTKISLCNQYLFLFDGISRRTFNTFQSQRIVIARRRVHNISKIYLFIIISMQFLSRRTKRFHQQLN